jgi:SulP family sulfate permease
MGVARRQPDDPPRGKALGRYARHVALSPRLPRHERWPWLFGGVRPVHLAGLARDALAGLTVAAMNVPQVLGYARIAGMPLVTGLYSLLLPLVAFATFASSRYLVVAADSATAAVLAGGLSPMAPVVSAHYVALAGVVALLTAAGLFLARLFRLGFLADFLSQTVLVGFLTGVGLQVGVGMAGEMIGVQVDSSRTLNQLLEVARGVPRSHLPTVCLAAAVVGLVLVLRKYAPHLPGPLFAVVGALAASALFDLPAHGVAVIQGISGGLPSFHVPSVRLAEIPPLLPLAAWCFLIVLTQSAATARAYASRHHDTLDENRDILGLAMADTAAALTGTFVVNGSPTQTAMVERSGGRSQATHLVTAAVVALVLLFLTGPLRHLPRCVLGAIVFTIAIGLVDVRGLRDIRRESPGECRLALLTAAVVVGVGVEQGIVLAIVLSLLRHVRHSYRPHTAVLVEKDGQWLPMPATPGAVSRPGLVVFQFGADLFYANASHFADDVRALVAAPSVKVDWLVLDAGAITSLDYSAARIFRDLQQDLTRRGTGLVLVHAGSSLRADLSRHRLRDVVGGDHVFDSLHEALGAIRERRIACLRHELPHGVPRPGAPS